MNAHSNSKIDDNMKDRKKCARVAKKINKTQNRIEEVIGLCDFRKKA
jgi:hypothetical protein